MEEGYFAAADEFTRILLPFQDTSLGDDPAADTEPSVLEKILDPSS